jgi:hypothetical protein
MYLWDIVCDNVYWNKPYQNSILKAGTSFIYQNITKEGQHKNEIEQNHMKFKFFSYWLVNISRGKYGVNKYKLFINHVELYHTLYCISETDWLEAVILKH